MPIAHQHERPRYRASLHRRARGAHLERHVVGGALRAHEQDLLAGGLGRRRALHLEQAVLDVRTDPAVGLAVPTQRDASAHHVRKNHGVSVGAAAPRRAFAAAWAYMVSGRRVAATR